VHLIQNQPTQDNYADELTVPPMGWESIEVSISDAPAMMRLLGPRGEPLDELLVEPETLSLERAGGVQFKTNPATPNLAATISAYAYRKGEPVISGLRPRTVQPIFGPKLFQGLVGNVASGVMTQLFSSAVPSIWGGVYLRLHNVIGDPDWHFQVAWTNLGQAGPVFDFYGFAGQERVIVLPVLGDTITVSGRQGSGAVKSITPIAYLTNLAPFSLWSIAAKNVLVHVEGQVIPAGIGQTLVFDLPLFAGAAALSAIHTGPSAQVVFELRGFDEAGNVISRPYNSGPAAKNVPFAAAVDLAPHRVQLIATNQDAANSATIYVTVTASV
jgi:hypothetical protein